MSPSSTVSGFSVHDKIQEVCSHLFVMPLRIETQQNNTAHGECSVREDLDCCTWTFMRAIELVNAAYLMDSSS